jgi:hypothetical protein
MYIHSAALTLADLLLLCMHRLTDFKLNLLFYTDLKIYRPCNAAGYLLQPSAMFDFNLSSYFSCMAPRAARRPAVTVRQAEHNDLEAILTNYQAAALVGHTYMPGWG